MIVLLLASNAASAVDFVYVPDMGTLSWQMTPDGFVYLRNLNSYNNSYLGCCYNWRVDTTTTAGKSIWSAMLVKIAQHAPLYIGVGSMTVPGPVLYIGNW